MGPIGPLLDQITRTLGSSIMNILWAVLILIVGWLVALFIASLIRKGLGRVTWDNRLMSQIGFDRYKGNIEVVISKFVYYLLMVFVIVAVLDSLQLTAVTGPLNIILAQIVAFVPSILTALAYAFVAWLVATAAKFIITKLLGATKLDDAMSSQIELQSEGQPPLSEALGTIVYWFIILMFVPSILAAVGMEETLAPIMAMITSLMLYLPSILGAGLVFVIGWYVAKIVRRIVINFLVALGADRWGQRIGIGAAEGQTLSGIIGTVVYVLILIPVLISALQVLNIAAISIPATNMLNSLLAAIPLVFGALIILAVTYFIARLVADLVSSLLTSIGFNRILAMVGLGSEPVEGQRTPSEVVGYLVLVALMLFAAIESAQMLGFTMVGALLSASVVFAGQIALGVVVLWLGLFLANLARNVILRTAGGRAYLLSQLTYVIIVAFTVAMGLRTMGIASDIVNLAFGLLLGAIAIAVALAFGLGSREIAAREVESVLTRLRAKEE